MTDDHSTRPERWGRVMHDGWDVVVIGGGITGAAILLEAVRRGLSAVLVEQHDFASGTSSKSSKMVHGGLRYLKQGRIDLTRQSVLERRRLLREAPGLVERFGYLLLDRPGQRPPRAALQAGLMAYDAIAGTRTHRYVGRSELARLVPHASLDRIRGALYYEDAWVDDARLVLRVLQEAERRGAVAINYAGVHELQRGRDGRVAGVTLRDEVTGVEHEVTARLVVNATGAWVDQLRAQVTAGADRIRPLRGSHLVLPAWRVPVSFAVTLMHPTDGRPVYVYPWMGATVVGTTDLDHGDGLDTEPRISADEAAYLLAVVDAIFPGLAVTPDDVIATYAGVRPVVDTGAADPSRESRDHVVWAEDGLLTVTGGKLTTFRAIAVDALDRARALDPSLPGAAPARLFAASEPASPTLVRQGAGQARRLLGRYGPALPSLEAGAQPGELDPIPGADHCWAEARWGARGESVVHLDDLLLRRTRLGNVLPSGGLVHRDRIRDLCQAELGWQDDRWESELERYQSLWTRFYGPLVTAREG